MLQRTQIMLDEETKRDLEILSLETGKSMSSLVREALAEKMKTKRKKRSKKSPQKSEVMKLMGKYKHLKPTKKIDIDNIRDYIDYSNL